MREKRERVEIERDSMRIMELNGIQLKKRERGRRREEENNWPMLFWALQIGLPLFLFSLHILASSSLEIHDAIACFFWCMCSTF